MQGMLISETRTHTFYLLLYCFTYLYSSSVSPTSGGNVSATWQRDAVFKTTPHLVLAQHAHVKSCCPSLLQASFNYWKAPARCPWSLFQAEQPQLIQPFLQGEVLQPSDLLHGPSLDLLKQIYVKPLYDSVIFYFCYFTLVTLNCINHVSSSDKQSRQHLY